MHWVAPVARGDVPDAIVVPISLSYDRVVESGSMSSELVGGTKQAEALMTALGGVFTLIRDAASGRARCGKR